MQSKSSMEEQEAVKGDMGHRAWHSFSSNAASTDSPCIGAHYGTASLSRKPSNEPSALDEDTSGSRHVGCGASVEEKNPPDSTALSYLDIISSCRSPSHAGFADKPGTTAFHPTLGQSMAQQTPVQAQPLRQPATPPVATSQLQQVI